MEKDPLARTHHYQNPQAKTDPLVRVVPGAAELRSAQKGESPWHLPNRIFGTRRLHFSG
jgi:hypothetical protein